MPIPVLSLRNQLKRHTKRIDDVGLLDAFRFSIRTLQERPLVDADFDSVFRFFPVLDQTPELSLKRGTLTEVNVQERYATKKVKASSVV